MTEGVLDLARRFLDDPGAFWSDDGVDSAFAERLAEALLRLQRERTDGVHITIDRLETRLAEAEKALEQIFRIAEANK